MITLRRLLAVFVTTVALLLPVGAYASGSSSVLIADPAHRVVASAHRDDARYQRLASALGFAADTLPASGESPPAVGAVFRSDLRLTWLRDDTEIGGGST